MRLAIVIDRIATEKPRATSLVLALAAARRGHDVHLLDVGDLTYFPDGHVGGRARTVPGADFADPRDLLHALRAHDAHRETVSTAQLDVVWLRHNPSEWAATEQRIIHSAILLGRIAMERGVLVLDDTTNLRTIVETLARQDFVVAQEYIPAAREGDVRLFMMNGAPLEADGAIAAFRRLQAPGDFRGNLSVGAKAVPATPDERMLALARSVGPRLVQDGIFLAGLDIAGDKVLEINTLSPGGLNTASRLHGVDFAGEVIRAVERKVELGGGGRAIGNRELAAL